MKSRHAAALALAGWYLMVPPPLASNPNKPDLSAPLSKWTVRKKTVTAAQCQAHRDAGILLEHDPNFRQYAEITARQKGQIFSIEKLRDFTEPQKCIASDDPHLKGN
jgi:hypothetical protein